MIYHGHANDIAEFDLQMTEAHDDPYNHLEVDVVVQGDGADMRVPAFWAGADRWKVRVAPPHAGEYRLRAEVTEGQDEGLAAFEGRIVCEPYGGDNPLQRHGRIRVAANKRSFEHADGTPFFWMGDTWWMGLSTRLSWPQGFRELALDRVTKGFNVIQIVAGPYPDMPPFDPRNDNPAGYPFTEGFECVNPAYYDHADLKLAHLAASGLMPCIVGMWGYYLPVIGLERVKRFWRYLVARYGALPVVWCVCGEGAMPYYLSEDPEGDVKRQKEGWTEVLRYVKEIDGHDNLRTIHPTQRGKDQVTDPAAMDFEMLQTGHGDLESVGNTMRVVGEAVGAEPRMPVINSEVNYEGILGRAWENIQRLCFYHSVLQGAAGHTYGANGIWQMNTEAAPYGPSPHGRNWGSTPWRVAAQLPGGRQVALGASFLRRFPLGDCEVRRDWLPDMPENNPYACVAMGVPGTLRIIYTPFSWDIPPIQNLEPDVTYAARFFNTRSGEVIDLGEATPENGTWKPPLTPEVHDWLVALEAR